MSDVEISEIEDYLSPFFDFLNSNLAVLMSNMDDALAFEVVLGSWNRFVSDAEALIVPQLIDDQKERKQWDERRFQFFLKLVEIAFDFFLGDGQGLSKTMLRTKSFVDLESIISNYFSSKEDLINLYLTIKGDPVDSFWILKLVKMKGGKDFVDDALKRRCFSRVD